MRTREDDAVAHLVVADTHDSLVFFTDRGRCFQVRAFEIPEESRQARGQPVINFLSGMEPGERVTAVVRHPYGADHDCLVMATRLGEVKRTPLSEFASAGRRGLVAMDLEQGDELVSARLARDGDDAVLVTAQGKALRFPVSALRQASRQSGGVRGIKLSPGDAVVAMDIAKDGGHLLVVTARGYGKRTPLDQYPRQGRGGQGVVTYKVGDRTGPVAAARVVRPGDEVAVASQDGIMLRTPVDEISVQGRGTQGVRLMDLAPGDAVSCMAVVSVRSDEGQP
jgi:DNA gyrase subunit A